MKNSSFSAAAAAVIAGLLTLGTGCKVQFNTKNSSATPEQTPQAVVSAETEITPEVTLGITPEFTAEITTEIIHEITPEAAPEVAPSPLSEDEAVKVYATASHTWLLTFNEDEVLRDPETEETVEEGRADETRTFELAGRRLQLQYAQTLLCSDESSNIIDYIVLHDGIAASDESSTDSASFYGNGSLFCLMLRDHPIALETGGKKDNESVRRAIEELFKDEVDFNKYEFCDVQEPAPDGGVTYTTFTWLNKKNGIPITWDSVEVYLTEDGAADFFLSGARHDMIDSNALPDDLSVERYMPHFEKKLYELYGNEFSDGQQLEYKVSYAQITKINDSVCLVVSFGIQTFSDAISLAVIIG